VGGEEVEEEAEEGEEEEGEAVDAWVLVDCEIM
jgi:hypothetical protein